MNYRVDHIPLATPHRRRQGLKIIPTSITIHNTGNPSSTARNERGWLTNPSNEREASFHIAIDQLEAVECIPLDEKAIHSGSAAGNLSSIGIEICESGDYAKTLDNASCLVAALLQKRGWGVERLKRHYDWSGKVCPHMMYDRGRWTGWTSFKKLVQAKLLELQHKPPKTSYPNSCSAGAAGDTEGQASSGAVALEAGQIRVEVNGKVITDSLLDSRKGITYVPLRAVAQALGAQVHFDRQNNIVKVTL